MLTVTDLLNCLRALGVREGDTLMVHASLRAIGPVVGGAVSVVRALEEAVTPEGSLMMVVGARDEWSWVNERPEEERAGLLADAPPFDAAETPADPEIGVLAEVFRTLPGTMVSNHPEGRFAARGRAAGDLTRDVPWNDYFGPGSPLQRLVEAGGSVLRLGADPNTVTLMHYAEYLAELPNKRRARRHRKVTGPAGAEIRTIDCLDDSDGIADYPGEDYFAVILGEFLKAGGGKRGQVGRAPSELLPAREVVAFAAAWMTRNLAVPEL